MSVTLSVERYDEMQSEILELRDKARAAREGMVYLGSSHFMGKSHKRLYLPSEVIEQLNKELALKVQRLEASVLPVVAKKKTGWWWNV